METLFAWRRIDQPGWLDLGPEGVGPTLCPACQEKLRRHGRDEPDDEYVRTPVSLGCPLCVWGMDYVVHSTWVDPYKPIFSYDINTATLLKEFDLSSTEVGFDELGAFVRGHPKLLPALHWRRLEALVADVFRHLGYH